MRELISLVRLWASSRGYSVVDVHALYDAVGLAGPEVDAVSCLECGGILRRDFSPPWYDHAEDCPGMVRAEAVRDRVTAGTISTGGQA